MRELIFDMEKARSYLKASKEIITDIQMNQNQTAEDHLYNLLTVSLEAHFFSHMAEERELTYYCPRPKFFDWLFRRERVVKFKLDVKDLLLNPPKYPVGTTRIYIPTEL